ncbi:MAG: MFS transporter [Myxococcaceae bacterium]|nr:MAG: MFS transporter [Myxococcaceae bacterium]
MNLPAWLSNALPIFLLLVAIGVVLARLPKVDMGHSEAFKRRRVMNWVPLGMTYAFLYFGRYNLSAIVDKFEHAHLLTKLQFGDIDGVGAITYGVAFLLNGPLTDRFGGRKTLLIAAGGSAVMNVVMALAVGRAAEDPERFYSTLMFANAANMYFQSFGAVSIVKVNAPWFHVRERGVLGGLFGILISLGLYFAYDWAKQLAEAFGLTAAFWVPAAVLAACWVVAFTMIRDTPSKAGFEDFDTGDATSGDTEPAPVFDVVKRMLSQRAVLIIIAIEFCSGFLRQGVMKWYRLFAKATGDDHSFVYTNWGMVLCVAGILGGVFAGFISDHVFESRRGPVAAVLYGGLLLGALVAFMALGSPVLGWTMLFMSLCVIGVHGMLSGTASMDFGGTKSAGLVTGVIDGFVYLGTASQAFLYGHLLPDSRSLAAHQPTAWKIWPGAMIVMALIGVGLCSRVWNARPKPRSAAAH